MKYRLLICLLFVALPWPCARAYGQSGRNSRQDESGKPTGTKIKPVPPPPLQGGVPDKPQKPDKTDDTLRINSDLVTLVATVSAMPGVPPQPFNQEDFEVYEDGVKQDIADFARTADAPLRMVMLFDTSSSIAPRIGFERRAAMRFFERVMRPQDQAALISFSDEIQLLQGFTGQVPQLTKATKLLRPKGATSLYDAIYLGAGLVAPAKGRHVIIVVSDGGDTTSAKTLREALNAAQNADAVIYAVFTGSNSTSLNIQDLAAIRALESMTAETGGELYRPRISADATDEQIDNQSMRELDGVFERLAAQLSTQYLLGYYPGNENRDGKFRKLDVRVKRQGYAVRARSGYYAPKS
ncbi:MAG: VWA domain-containing protein [Blastocatellia bacterium]